jgi:hypothetical protein
MLNLALVGEQRGRVRDLLDFRKSHRIPEDHSERAQAFIRRIATSDLEADLDLRFAELRQHLGFKRIDMDVAEPVDGAASIQTPLFCYRVSIRLCDEDVNTTVCERRVDGFADPKPLLSDQFAAAFGSTFDSVAIAPAEPVDVESFIDWVEEQSDSQLVAEYDRTATWCRVLFAEQQSASMLIESDAIALTSMDPASPASLLRSFMELREQLPAMMWDAS